jgi:hypothetical protein
MIFQGHLAIGALDVAITGISAEIQDFVIISLGH